MEDQRFDDLVKRLCTTRLTRMSVLRGLAAGAVAAVAGVKVGAGRSVSAAAGTCRNLGHPCEGNQDCCAGIEFCDVTGPGNAKRCVSTPNCGGLGEVCCAGNTCDLGLECNGTICVDPDTQCGAIGQPCCDGTGSNPNFCDPGGVCDETQGPNGTCVACGGNNQPCCANETCDTPNLTCALNGICKPCGQIDQLCCDGVCAPNATCIQAPPGDPICVAVTPSPPGPPGPVPPTRCTSSAQCPTSAPLCNTNTGQCVSIGGLRCKTGETPQQCCIRSVKTGCKRKQQTAHAHKNCLKKGKKRCKTLLAGLV